jgi:hypothetical protein
MHLIKDKIWKYTTKIDMVMMMNIRISSMIKKQIMMKKTLNRITIMKMMTEIYDINKFY